MYESRFDDKHVDNMKASYDQISNCIMYFYDNLDENNPQDRKEMDFYLTLNCVIVDIYALFMFNDIDNNVTFLKMFSKEIEKLIEAAKKVEEEENNDN